MPLWGQLFKSRFVSSPGVPDGYAQLSILTPDFWKWRIVNRAAQG
jgi:hypothetical protein